MSLFLSLLPLYLLGNLHCAGMCGPLMMLLAKNRYRAAYFFGRLTSYALAGMLSAEIGLLFFRPTLGALFSLTFGLIIIAIGLLSLFHLPLPGRQWLAKKTARLSTLLAALLKWHGPLPLFLFGVCTLLLPCGQTLIVFSACAIDARPLVGLANGALFALLTSPSLILSMSAFKLLKHNYHLLIGAATLVIGTLAICRGIAEFNLIPHLVLHDRLHIVLY